MGYAALQSIVASTETQLASVQAEKATLITELVLLTGPDVGSVSSSGGEGSESYTAQTLSEKIEQLSRVEQLLTETLFRQKELAGASGPGVILPACRGVPW